MGSSHYSTKFTGVPSGMLGLVVIQGERLPSKGMLGTVVPRRPETRVWRPPRPAAKKPLGGGSERRRCLLFVPGGAGCPAGAGCPSGALAGLVGSRGNWNPLVGSVKPRFNSHFSRLAVSVSLPFLPSTLVCGHVIYSDTVMWEITGSYLDERDVATFLIVLK